MAESYAPAIAGVGTVRPGEHISPTKSPGAALPKQLQEGLEIQ